MNYILPSIGLGALLLISTGPLQAIDLTIALAGSEPMTRNTAKYQCDGQSGALGLPTGVFSVQYLNGNGNSLAVLPLQGHSLIFANVMSGSGARYAAGPYIWWDAGERGVHLTSNSLSGQQQTSCHEVKY